MFLFLTDDKEKKLRVQVETICFYKPDEEGTYIEFNGSGLIVKESPETIDMLLTESYVTLKS